MQRLTASEPKATELVAAGPPRCLTPSPQAGDRYGWVFNENGFHYRRRCPGTIGTPESRNSSDPSPSAITLRPPSPLLDSFHAPGRQDRTEAPGSTLQPLSGVPGRLPAWTREVLIKNCVKIPLKVQLKFRTLLGTALWAAVGAARLGVMTRPGHSSLTGWPAAPTSFHRSGRSGDREQEEADPGGRTRPGVQ